MTHPRSTTAIGRLTLLVVFASLCLPASARAQGRAGEARLSVAGALGAANPLHGDFSFTAPAWLGAVRIALSRRVAIDVGAAGWWHGETTARDNVPIFGPDGIIGRFGRLTTETTQRVTGYSLSILGHAGDRLTVAAGGGAGVYMYRRRLEQSSEGCEAPNPLTCQPIAQTFTSGRLGMQALADVTFAGHRLQPFGQFRYELPDLGDAGSGQLIFLAGLRLVVR
jgi:hypothetical protein